MDTKHSNLDAELERGISTLRAQAASEAATQRAEREVAWGVKRASDRRMRVALRLAGLAGTAAVASLALWPRPGEGLAWAQVVDRSTGAVRIHEKVELPGKNGTWHPFLERWTDGNRFRAVYSIGGRKAFEARYDGRRQYASMGARGYATVQTVALNQKSPYLPGLWTFGLGNTTIDQLLKSKDGTLVEKKEITLADGRPGIRYRLKYPGDPKSITYASTFDADVDPETGHVVRWASGADGRALLSARGTVEYPASIDESQFDVPDKAELPAQFYDLDLLRPMLDKSLAKGLGTISVPGAKAVLRAVLVEGEGRVWAFWTGTPPNGELREPLKIHGVPTGRTMGEPNFTTTRPLIQRGFAPSSALSTPLAGLCVQVKGKVPSRLTLEIPMYKPDTTKPIRDKAGATVGYRSRFVGYATASNVLVIRIPEIHMVAKSLGFARKASVAAGDAR